MLPGDGGHYWTEYKQPVHNRAQCRNGLQATLCNCALDGGDTLAFQDTASA